MTDSVTDLLGKITFRAATTQVSYCVHRSRAILAGFEPRELIGRPSLELVHPDEFLRVRQLH